MHKNVKKTLLQWMDFFFHFLVSSSKGWPNFHEPNTLKEA